MANTLRSEFPVYRLHALVNYKYINSTLAAPSVSLPSVVETLPGHEVTFSVNGTLPLNTTVMKNSTVLFTGVESAAALIFHEEGKFTCMARNSFGSYFKEFSVIFGGMNWFCQYRLSSSFASPARRFRNKNSSIK